MKTKNIMIMMPKNNKFERWLPDLYLPGTSKPIETAVKSFLKKFFRPPVRTDYIWPSAEDLRRFYSERLPYLFVVEDPPSAILLNMLNMPAVCYTGNRLKADLGLFSKSVALYCVSFGVRTLFVTLDSLSMQSLNTFYKDIIKSGVDSIAYIPIVRLFGGNDFILFMSGTLDVEGSGDWPATIERCIGFLSEQHDQWCHYSDVADDILAYIGFFDQAIDKLAEVAKKRYIVTESDVNECLRLGYDPKSKYEVYEDLKRRYDSFYFGLTGWLEEDESEETNYMSPTEFLEFMEWLEYKMSKDD